MTSEAQKNATAKYAKSFKGKLARRKAQQKYNQTKRGKAARRRYMLSSKGVAAVARSRRKVRQFKV